MGSAELAPYGSHTVSRPEEEAMSEIRTIVERVWGAMEKSQLGDLDGIISPDCHFKMPGFEMRGGPEVIKPLFAAYIAAFPDLKHTVQTAIESNGTIALELLVTGTHKGPMQTPQGTIPATGNKVVGVVRLRPRG